MLEMGVERSVLLVMVNTCKHFGGQRLLSGIFGSRKLRHFSREEQFFAIFPKVPYHKATRARNGGWQEHSTRDSQLV